MVPLAWIMRVTALATLPATPVPVELRAYPEKIELTTSRDYQSVVVQARFGDDTTRDVTAESALKASNAALVRLDGNRVTPLADGDTELEITWGTHALRLPVTVREAKTDRPISFKLDVMPVFMKAGCNAGSCHGSARGQDGFRLSLFGYDPDGDYHRLTREQNGRRINLADPDESLVIQKALGAVPHTGGDLFDRESEYYATLMRWLKAVVPKDKEDVATPVSAEVLPNRLVLAGPGKQQQLTVRVTYSDGTDRDVTTAAVFQSNNATVAEVSKTGGITARRRGEAFVMARYATFTVGAQVIVVPDEAGFVFPENVETNYIDALVNQKLRKLRIAPSAVCTDEAFLRRAYIDIVGQLPPPAAFRAFTASGNPQKREQLVDELLTRKEFVELWVMKWAELLQIRSNKDFSYKSALLYYNWLQEQIAGNVPIDQVVHKLLGARGGTFSNPPTNFYQVETDTKKLAENTAQVFMGVRLQCAQCHNHPFDRWTMDDYYSYTAFFAQVGRKNAEDPREKIIFNNGGGKMEHPVTKKDMPPQFPGGGPADVKDRDRRGVLAEWLASPDNPYFARNLANIVWAHFLGRGIVEPVDDVRISNPPVNPELLDALAKRLVEYQYDFKKMVRDICTSQAYQRSTRALPSNITDDQNFSRAAIRRIRAEVLLDCISQVTGTPDKFKGLPQGARAVQIADGQVSNYFLTTFGRATRDTVCSCEVVMEPNLSQALHLINGSTVTQKIRQGKQIPALLKDRSPGAVLDDLFVRCLSRLPQPVEKQALLAKVDGLQNPVPVLEDIFWALLNSKEFIFNH